MAIGTLLSTYLVEITIHWSFGVCTLLCMSLTVNSRWHHRCSILVITVHNDQTLLGIDASTKQLSIVFFKYHRLY
jgi:hypothetical protein